MTTPPRTATLVRKLAGYGGHARLYRCDPPLPYSIWDDELTEKRAAETEHVVVFTAVTAGIPETYILPADAAGKVTDWDELEGSFHGGHDHERALHGAGYEVTPRPHDAKEARDD